MSFIDISLPDSGDIAKLFKAVTNVNLTALWKRDDNTVPYSQRIGVQLRTRPSTAKSKRKVSAQIVYPYVSNADTGAVDYVSVHVDLLAGEDAPDAAILDAISFAENFLQTQQFQSAASNGVHPS